MSPWLRTGSDRRRPNSAARSLVPADRVTSPEAEVLYFTSHRHTTAPTFAEDYAEMCRSAAPFMKFLCRAVGVGF